MTGDSGAYAAAHVIAMLREVAVERTRQNARWGQQDHLNGTGLYGDRAEADHRRAVCDRAARVKRVTWRHILAEEVAEAFAEKDPARLRAELIQVAAVATAWAEAIDRAEGTR